MEHADLGAVMCSYNRVFGKNSCEQNLTMTRDLKGTMGFKGLVMSDWWPPSLRARLRRQGETKSSQGISTATTAQGT